jgi:Family of unknown function (DUF5677)
VTSDNKFNALMAYAQKLMDVGIEVTAQANFEIGLKWAKEPKVIALTLLCRTLGNMKGAVQLMQQGMFVEAQILTRCCIENLICIGAVRQTGDEFVEELLRADAASKKKQVNLVIGMYAEDTDRTDSVIRLREVVKGIEASHPKATQLNTKKLADGNPVGSSYLMFSVLSEKAVHVSASSLARHLGQDLEGENLFLRVEIAPIYPEMEFVKLLQELFGTVLGIIVGTNEIVGGTNAGSKLAELLNELDHLKVKENHK